jgi:TPR repeat protein
MNVVIRNRLQSLSRTKFFRREGQSGFWFMRKRAGQFSLLLIGAFMILWGSVALAGECRGMLRPLLLQKSPQSAELAAVREICKAEVAKGDPDSEYRLAMFYLGLTSWDVRTAIPMIMSAAQSGVPEAQYWLAWQYDKGPLLADDVDMARHWYERAGDNEHRLALQRLAEAYEHGDLGLPVNVRKASILRSQAARCENNSG